MHPSRNALWSYAAGGLGPFRRRRLRAHAGRCSGCRVELERAVVARRLLAGRDTAEPTAAELRAWRTDVLARAAGASPLRRRAPLAALLAAAVALAVWVLPGRDDLAPRGSGPEHRLSVRLLCVDAASEARFIDPATAPCPARSYLKFMVGGAGSERRGLAVLAVGGAGPEWLYPREPGVIALPAELTPLPGSRQLGDAPLRLVVLAVDEVGPNDPLLAWALAAPFGESHDVLGRADAVVVEVPVVGGMP